MTREEYEKLEKELLGKGFMLSNSRRRNADWNLCKTVVREKDSNGGERPVCFALYLFYEFDRKQSAIPYEIMHEKVVTVHRTPEEFIELCTTKEMTPEELESLAKNFLTYVNQYKTQKTTNNEKI